MNKTIKAVLAVGALLVGTQQASAITFSDADNIGGFQLSSALGASYMGIFDISSSEPGNDSFTVTPSDYTVDEFFGTTFTSQTGFNPDLHTLTSVGLQFWFRDAAQESFLVTVDGQSFDPTSNGGVYFFSNSGITGSIMADLQFDGRVSYSVGIVSGVATLDYARLKAEATVNPVATPDAGATAAMLGLGFLGLGMLGRRK